jgi:ribosomal-protein-alanine N-acetyltransferase
MNLRTERLRLRELTAEDAPFMVALLNDPSFIQNIGDRGVRTPEDARRYIANGPAASYARFGFGLLLVELAEASAPIGICGLLKRDELPEPDIGFAFLPAFRGNGYAFESAEAITRHARGSLGLTRVLAIVNPANERSIRLLEKLGFTCGGPMRLSHSASELSLFSTDWTSQAEM